MELTGVAGYILASMLDAAIPVSGEKQVLGVQTSNFCLDLLTFQGKGGHDPDQGRDLITRTLPAGQAMLELENLSPWSKLVLRAAVFVDSGVFYILQYDFAKLLTMNP